MADDADMGDWKVDDMITASGSFGSYTETMDPLSLDSTFGSSDKVMDSMFDFTSASSSPSAFGNGQAGLDSPEMPTIKHDTPSKGAPAKKVKYDANHVSVSDCASRAV
jgi:hypothetical protein